MLILSLSLLKICHSGIYSQIELGEEKEKGRRRRRGQVEELGTYWRYKRQNTLMQEYGERKENKERLRY